MKLPMPRLLLGVSFLCSALVFAGWQSLNAQGSPAQTVTIVVNAKAPSHPFPHFWEQMFGSGRAILFARASYQSDYVFR